MLAEANNAFLPRQEGHPRGVTATGWKWFSYETIRLHNSGRSVQFSEQFHILSSRDPTSEKVRNGAPHS